uniref:IQ domain-containing protein E-like n=1 Tax=Myxine glutinosa TaxID=7769 RepID=UPI00358F246F
MRCATSASVQSTVSAGFCLAAMEELSDKRVLGRNDFGAGATKWKGKPPLLSHTLKKINDQTISQRNSPTATTRTTSETKFLRESLGLQSSRNPRNSGGFGRPRIVASSVDPEDLLAQVWQLKRDLRRRETQLNETQARCRHLEEDAMRQDRHLKQLLQQQAQGLEVTQGLKITNGEKRATVTSLQQKVLRLELCCKEKESTIRSLQSDLRTTNLQELRIMLETCYNEIDHLRASLDDNAHPDIERLQELEDENHFLKKSMNLRLRESAAATPVSGDAKRSVGSLAKRNADQKKWEQSKSSITTPDNEKLQRQIRLLKEDRKSLQAELTAREREVERVRKENCRLEIELKRSSFQVFESGKSSKNYKRGSVEVQHKERDGKCDFDVETVSGSLMEASDLSSIGSSISD